MVVTFLGTSSAPPQVERRQCSISIKYRNHNLLFDVGEAAQVQMIKNKINFKNLTIFLTHLHSDHTQGLIGILSTRNFYDMKSPVTIIGPPWTSSFVFLQLLAYRFYPDYEIKIIESEGGTVFLNNDLLIESFKVNHTEDSLGYKITTISNIGVFNVEKAIEKGVPKGEMWKKLQEGEPIEINSKTIFPSEVLNDSEKKSINVVITGDTKIDQNVINKSANVDLLIHDATYPPSETERAQKYKHSTCLDAAYVAKFAKVERLIMTHISNIHENLEESLKESKKIFKNCDFAHDDLQIVLTIKD